MYDEDEDVSSTEDVRAATSSSGRCDASMAASRASRSVGRGISVATHKHPITGVTVALGDHLLVMAKGTNY